MIKTIINNLREAKDINVDFSEDFEIALKDGNVIVTQLFGYNTKYPIFIETDKKINGKLKEIDEYDIDISSVSVDKVGEGVALVLEGNIDAEKEYFFKITLQSGKEKFQLL